MTATITLSSDQVRAVDTVRHWLRTKRSQQLTFGGAAGTGKTTVMNSLWPELKSAGCVFATPSAKAAVVLKSKGVERVGTIHSLIYNFKGTTETWDGKEKPIFEDRDDGDWGGDYTPEMIAVDESSLLNGDDYDALMSKGLPVLFVGDHYQLAPVGRDPGIMRDPDIRLETIHRQESMHPGLALAHAVRQGGAVDRKYADGDRLKIGGMSSDIAVVDYCLRNDIDQVIVGVNGKTTTQQGSRHRINELMRQALVMKSMLDVGERIICRFNNRREGVYNGQIFRVEAITGEDKDAFVCNLSTECDDGWTGLWRGIRVQKISLGNPDYLSSDRVSGTCVFEYAGAVTCHASQGSQWRRVCVIDKDMRFDMQRWRYTAFTRFADHLSVVLR